MLEKRGLIKLVEECGELVQICCKKMTCMYDQFHYDGSNLAERIEEEIADVMAANEIVIKNFNLDREAIIERSNQKLKLFQEWESE